MTISDCLAYSIDRLSVEKKLSKTNASFEANQILQYVLGLSHFQLLMNLNMDVDELKLVQFKGMVQKRCENYPLQYMINEWDFFDCKLKVGEGVLIPRSDTEVLVEEVLESIKDIANPVLADLCSGSGCIAIAIAKNRPDSHIYAVELSDLATPYLIENVALNNVNSNIFVTQKDVLLWTPPQLLDCIVSNPPYLTESELTSLQEEVRYEPRMALAAGEDGLTFFENISKLYWQYLKPDGILAFEIGYQQALAVKDILFNMGYYDIKIKKDLSGLDRVVYAKKQISIKTIKTKLQEIVLPMDG